MRCPADRSILIDLLYEEVGEAERARLEAHLLECVACQEALARLRATAAAADRWTAPPPPRGLAERALARIASELGPPPATVAPALAIQHVLGVVLAGALAAGVSLVLVGKDLASDAWHAAEHPLGVGVAGALWAALYAGVGLLARWPDCRRLAAATLGATALSVLLAPVVPMPAVVEACRRWLEGAQASVALNALLVLAGALYGAAPVALAGALALRPRPGDLLAPAVRLAGGYALLLAPSVYLQCQALTLALLAPWVAGLLLGAGLGALGGAAAGARLRPAAT